MKTLLLALLLSSYCLAQSGGLTNATRGFPQPNEGTTGTQLNLTASVNAQGNAITATTAQTTVPVWIVVGGNGTSGNAVLASSGTLAPCVMDLSVTNGAGYFVVASTTTGGQCHPTPTAPSGGTFVIGRLHDPTTTAGQTALVTVSGYIYSAGGASLPSITDTGTAVTIANPTTITNPGTLTIGTSGTSNGTIVLTNTVSGTVSLQTTGGALGSSVVSLPGSTGTVALINSSPAQTWTTAPIFSKGVNQTGQGAIVAPVNTVSTPETLILRSSNSMLSSRMAAGTVIRATWIGTCSSTAANASTFSIRYGTAGTVADGLLAQATTGVAATSGTAVPFRAVMEITFQTIGASATAVGTLTVYNQGTSGTPGNGGISTQAIQIITAAMTGINTTTTSAYFDLTYSSAATTTTATFTQAFIEFVVN